MRKILRFILGVILIMGVATAAPLLVEIYQEEPLSIPTDSFDTLEVIQIDFSVDSSCAVLFTAGGRMTQANSWLELGGTSLHPVIASDALTNLLGVSLSYSYLLSPGEHTLILKYTNRTTSYPARCENAYLQALIFLPDTGTNVVAEQPSGDAQPSVNTPSLISQGPYVNVAGATELVDASGRIIENAITDDKVYITNLPTGTYFARDGESTVVKIVKVD